MQYGLISKKCNMGRGPGKALGIIAQNQMSVHNAIWVKFVRLTRAQNKIAQYSVQQTIGTSLRPTKTQRSSLQHLCVGTGQTGVGYRSDICCRVELAKGLWTSPGQDPIGEAHVRVALESARPPRMSSNAMETRGEQHCRVGKVRYEEEK
jgi:hypothetical protein